MKRVIIESPYSGTTPEEIQRNVDYARACMRDSILRGEAPFASHLLYTQPGILDDANPQERRLGIVLGFLWGKCADLVAVYADHGVSGGMLKGIAEARLRECPIEWRNLKKGNPS